FAWDASLGDTLIFQRFDFADALRVIRDTSENPLKLTLRAGTWGLKTYRSRYAQRPPSQQTAGMRMHFDAFDANFDAFAPELGADNLAILNEAPFPFFFEFTVGGPRMRVGLIIGGMGNDNAQEPDSLDITLRTLVSGLSLAAVALDTRHFYFYPTFQFKNYRYRLLNSPRGEDFTLQQYTDRPELDLRITQPIGTIGAQFGFKLRPKNASNGYWGLGAWAGYSFRMRKRPYLRGVERMLSNDRRLGIDPFNWGVFLTLQLE
ncbi:MAG: hypothetical protein AAFO94_21970, partial [Bacteroidota bacterium]